MHREQDAADAEKVHRQAKHVEQQKRACRICQRTIVIPDYTMADAAVKAPTILVIDDDAEIRYSLSRVLSSRGYQVAEAPSGEQGVAVVKKGPAPDLVFLDVRMGGMSGIEALQ